MSIPDTDSKPKYQPMQKLQKSNAPKHSQEKESNQTLEIRQLTEELGVDLDFLKEDFDDGGTSKPAPK